MRERKKMTQIWKLRKLKQLSLGDEQKQSKTTWKKEKNGQNT